MTNKLNLACDYNQGAHPAILKQMLENNLVKSGVYGEDAFSESAKARIREACKAPEADVWFLVGGTQTNAVVLDSVLRPYEGVISVETGHICIHEAGAIERGGHKILAVKGRNGKLSAADILACWDTWESDGNRDHVVKPGAVYLSNPTELGTLYTLRELEDISSVCRDKGLCLYVDGARLAYALACPENDITMPDLARLCDVFYIGGTKCGTLLGEALVFPEHNTVPGFFSVIKQHGAVLAKGFVAGIQFDALFTDGLYEKIGRKANETAEKLKAVFAAKGVELAAPSPTNQVFVLLTQKQMDDLDGKVGFSRWDPTRDGRWIVRFAVNWATSDEEIEKLAELL